MNNLINNHLDAIKSALISLFKQPLSTLLILLMLGIALALPLTLHLAISSAQSLLGNLTATPQITLYLDLSADKVDQKTIAQQLQSNPSINTVQFINKDQALQEIQNSLGQNDLISILDGNPLPDTFVVTPKSSHPKEIEQLQAELNTLPMVEMAQVDAKWIRTLFNLENFLKQVLWFLSITLALAFVLVAYNTIRLQILTQRDEIEITRLLGAPASFIRRPFLYQALWQGFLSLLIGAVISYWSMKTSTPKFNLILEQYGIHLQWQFFNPIELVVIILIIIFLAIFGAWWATNQHLQEYKTRTK